MSGLFEITLSDVQGWTGAAVPWMAKSHDSLLSLAWVVADRQPLFLCKNIAHKSFNWLVIL